LSGIPRSVVTGDTVLKAPVSEDATQRDVERQRSLPEEKLDGLNAQEGFPGGRRDGPDTSDDIVGSVGGPRCKGSPYQASEEESSGDEEV